MSVDVYWLLRLCGGYWRRAMSYVLNSTDNGWVRTPKFDRTSPKLALCHEHGQDVEPALRGK